MFFGKRRFFEREVEEWHIECWLWLLYHLGGVAALKARRLALPTGEFFPKIEEQGHARAQVLLDRIMRLMGMEDWPCLLIARPRRAAQVGELLTVQSGDRHILGTFGFVHNEAAITYDPALLDRPYNAIATLAHELAHYRLHDTLEPAPGADVEPMLNELATELAVAFHGFALMAANAAFVFEQTQDFGRQAWQSAHSGYFSEDAWVFALAVFLALRDEAPDEARKHLKPHLAKKLDAAVKRLAAEPEMLEPLRNAPHR